MPPRVLLTRRIPSSVLAKLEADATSTLYAGPTAIARIDLLRRVAGKQALICLLTDQVDGEVLAAADALRIVANIAVGYNNIDLDACRERGIVVTNTPDVLTNACADFTWALILAISRRLGEAERQLRAGRWKGWALDHMLGTELRGKQLGLVGVGRIGRAVADKAQTFGMAVAYTCSTLACSGECHTPAARPAARYLGRGVTALPVDSGDATSDRPESAHQDEADGLSDQHRARPGR